MQSKFVKNFLETDIIMSLSHLQFFKALCIMKYEELSYDLKTETLWRSPVHCYYLTSDIKKIQRSTDLFSINTLGDWARVQQTRYTLNSNLVENLLMADTGEMY